MSWRRELVERKVIKKSPVYSRRVDNDVDDYPLATNFGRSQHTSNTSYNNPGNFQLTTNFGRSQDVSDTEELPHFTTDIVKCGSYNNPGDFQLTASVGGFQINIVDVIVGIVGFLKLNSMSDEESYRMMMILFAVGFIIYVLVK